jgi:hypothetical protein
MDHIPAGEIASQLPMFTDPTTIVDNELAGYWDAADALGNSPCVGDPEGVWERKRDGAAHGRLHRGRPPQPRPRLLGAVGSAGAIVGQLLGGVNVPIGIVTIAAPSSCHIAQRVRRPAGHSRLLRNPRPSISADAKNDERPPET